MSLGDIIVVLLLGAGIVLAVLSIRRSRKKGGCGGCSGCAGCSGCGAAVPPRTADDEKKQQQ